MSKASIRKFKREREQHHAQLRKGEADARERRLKGFKPATPGEALELIAGARRA